jgi:hypothetical protein
MQLTLERHACILLATPGALEKGRYCILHFLFQVSGPSMLPRQHFSKTLKPMKASISEYKELLSRRPECN